MEVVACGKMGGICWIGGGCFDGVSIAGLSQCGWYYRICREIKGLISIYVIGCSYVTPKRFNHTDIL